jgi:predicted enzyme related to lactoylglutathione lyase
MIGYALVGTNDLAKAKGFFETVLAGLGAKTAMANERMHLWANGQGPMVGVCKPYDQKAATAGNGTMVALAAPSREVVDKVYAAAIKAGGKDEGAPGERGGSFYGGYFRDLDGNKFVVFHM